MSATLTPYDIRRVLEHATGISQEDFIHDPHLKDTPERWLKMMRELCTPEEFKFTTFDNEEKVNEMVVVSPVPFYSLCAHHVIPFHGVAHVAYVPDSKLVGLSKIARAVKGMAKGLHVQENLTNYIAEYLQDKLEPIGVAVVMRAEHLCMAMRGVEVAGTFTTTSAMRGCFLDPEKRAREEFLSLIRR